MSKRKRTNFADKRHIARADYQPECGIVTRNGLSDMFGVKPKRMVNTGKDWSFNPENEGGECTTYSPEVIACMNELGVTLEEAIVICEQQELPMRAS